MSEYFLGVDGGQSSTTAVIGDAAGRVIGWATAGACNHVAAAEGRAKFLRVMGECIGKAAALAGMVTEGKLRFAAACLGMSGGPDDKADLFRELLVADRLEVTNDALIALSGAMSGGPGVIVIAGTGSISYGRNAAGEIARAGGWGYIFGDEGGSFDIARQALRAILREYEGWGPRTALTPVLLAAGEASEANELLHRFYTPDWPRSRVAELAKMVNHVAEQGDPTAIDIMHRCAQELAVLAASVTRQLWPEESVSEVAYVGGAFQSEILRTRFRMLIELNGGVCKPPEHSPAIGALYHAYRACNLHPTLKNSAVFKT